MFNRATVRRELRLFACTVGRAARRAACLAVMSAGLSLSTVTDLPWCGPVFVVAQLAIVVVVRYGIAAWSKWADEYVSWLNTGDVQAWAAWHREYVAWSAQHRARQLGPAPTGVAA